MNLLKRVQKSIKYRARNARYAALAKTYHFPGEYQRIYFYHIRKTGGTSLNHMFLGLSGLDGKEAYQQMGANAERIVLNGKIFVGWKQHLIEQGQYYYAFSHIPAHQLTLPPHTYTFTCLRDPVKRIISHYRMLLDHQASATPHPSFEIEKHWLGTNLLETVERMPPEHRLFQLYMFSRNFDVQEAVAGLQACNQVVFTETLDNDVQRLNADLGVQLQVRHARRSQHAYQASEAEITALRDMLAPEYQLLDAWKQISEKR